jgi:DNA-binding beta-propeller fold protein YncE
VWFNGLSATADIYYPEHDLLLAGAWSTGSAPNQIKKIGNRDFAVLSSLGAEIFTASADEPGGYGTRIPLPRGSNPYCFSQYGSSCFVTLLLADSVIALELDSGLITGGFSTRANPSGVETASGRVFVGYGNWPEASSPGGVSVYTMDDGQETQWLDTGVNTQTLKLQPSGLIHCYSTTYQNDGRITVIDPDGEPFIISEIGCGGAPGEAVMQGGLFISPDGWGQGGFIIYTEAGEHHRAELPVSPTGLAVADGFLYCTSFGSNAVYRIDPGSMTVVDSVSSGGEGPQGIVAVN